MEPPECLDLLDNLDGETQAEQLENLSERVGKLMKRATQKERITIAEYERYYASVSRP